MKNEILNYAGESDEFRINSKDSISVFEKPLNQKIRILKQYTRNSISSPMQLENIEKSFKIVCDEVIDADNNGNIVKYEKEVNFIDIYQFSESRFKAIRKDLRFYSQESEIFTKILRFFISSWPYLYSVKSDFLSSNKEEIFSTALLSFTDFQDYIYGLFFEDELLMNQLLAIHGVSDSQLSFLDDILRIKRTLGVFNGNKGKDKISEIVKFKYRLSVINNLAIHAFSKAFGKFNNFDRKEVQKLFRDEIDFEIEDNDGKGKFKFNQIKEFFYNQQVLNELIPKSGERKLILEFYHRLS